MNKPVIKVEGISKSYDISHLNKAGYGTIKDQFSHFLRKPFGAARAEHETFWALKDVSFEVNKGEIFGVIGKNGSGKSTLLKVLSRIIDPDHGRVEMHGRVASLLEVGTGFHPELTGRENIYFNGSMIGMSRQEIRRRFDEIVEFSEVEKFLDTPVKFYSSGMYVRLAFSVAAHLEPDIMILDEVLAVGDAGFQKKSLNKIVSTMESGCTVLMVTHGAESLRKLCKRGVMLQNGQVKSFGNIDKVLMDYSGSLPVAPDPRSTLLKEVDIKFSRVREPDQLSTEAAFEAEISFQITNNLPDCTINFNVEDSAGNYVYHVYTSFDKDSLQPKKGHYTLKIKIPRLGLKTGAYSTWFRFTAQKEWGEYALDSEREVIQVNGLTDKFANVIVPATWEWETQ